MTAPARITQAEMDRALKSVAASGLERARVIMDLRRARIEVIIGGDSAPEPIDAWDDGDGSDD